MKKEKFNVTDLFNKIESIEYKGTVNFNENTALGFSKKLYGTNELYILNVHSLPEKIVIFYVRGNTLKKSHSLLSIQSVLRNIENDSLFHIRIRCDIKDDNYKIIETIEGFAEVINKEDILEYLLDIRYK
jgi:hypothetical protein